jgi:hypothetical protein
VRVNKAGVQVFGVVLENAGKVMAAQQLLELKTEKSDLVVTIGTRADTVADCCDMANTLGSSTHRPRYWFGRRTKGAAQATL